MSTTKKQTSPVQAGDVLFIPEGYWHQIDSTGGTIAVNIWYESAVSDLLSDSHMSEFYLTRLLQSKTADKAQKLLQAVPCHPDLKDNSHGDYPTGMGRFFRRKCG